MLEDMIDTLSDCCESAGVVVGRRALLAPARYLLKVRVTEGNRVFRAALKAEVDMLVLEGEINADAIELLEDE